MKEEPLKVAILGAGGVGAWIAKMMRKRGHEVLASTGNDDVVRWNCSVWVSTIGDGLGCVVEVLA